MLVAMGTFNALGMPLGRIASWDGTVVSFGLDAGSDNSVWYQFWYRDPDNGLGTLGTALSNAVRLDYQ